MKLALYFFRQFIPPFLFGAVLFTSVIILDKVFDLIDLILNKGVSAVMVGQMFLLFLPTALPLAVPMGILLGCVVAFGQISEDNELTAVRAAGVSLLRVLWAVPVFALVLSAALVPFNTNTAPWANRAFRGIYERIIHAEPLINIEPRRFFAIRNIRIFADRVDSKTNRLLDVFVYQATDGAAPPDRIFAREGEITADAEAFHMLLRDGQMDRFDAVEPQKITHFAFDTYHITVPLRSEQMQQSTRFRTIANGPLKDLIQDLRAKGIRTSALEAELHLRFAMAFAPFALVLMGIPLATALKRGGRSFSLGVSLVVIFGYYLLLIFGLTLAEKGVAPAAGALWIANGVCAAGGVLLFRRMLRR